MKYTLEQSAELIPTLGTQLTIIATVKASSAPSDISVSILYSSLFVVFTRAPLNIEEMNTCFLPILCWSKFHVNIFAATFLFPI